MLISALYRKTRKKSLTNLFLIYWKSIFRTSHRHLSFQIFFPIVNFSIEQNRKDPTHLLLKNIGFCQTLLKIKQVLQLKNVITLPIGPKPSYDWFTSHDAFYMKPFSWFPKGGAARGFRSCGKGVGRGHTKTHTEKCNILRFKYYIDRLAWFQSQLLRFGNKWWRSLDMFEIVILFKQTNPTLESLPPPNGAFERLPI